MTTRSTFLSMTVVAGILAVALGAVGDPDPTEEGRLFVHRCVVLPLACNDAGVFNPPCQTPQPGAVCYVCDQPRLYEDCIFATLNDVCVWWEQPESSDCGRKFYGNCNATATICVWNNVWDGERCPRFNCY